jgi:putative flippase GtrA
VTGTQAEARSWQETIRSGYRMGLLSVLSFLLNYGLFFTLHKLVGMSPALAAALSMAVVVMVNFNGCKYYVYHDLHGDTKAQFLRFIVGTILFRSAEWCAFVLLAKWLSMDSIVLYPIVLSVSFLLKLLTYGKLVFNQRSASY